MIRKIKEVNVIKKYIYAVSLMAFLGNMTFLVMLPKVGINVKYIVITRREELNIISKDIYSDTALVAKSLKCFINNLYSNFD
jgi:hypothetical protein